MRTRTRTPTRRSLATGPRAAWALTLALALAPGATAQLGQGGDAVGPGGQTFPQALPEGLPDVSYAIDHEHLGARLGRRGWFDPLLDTAAFSNQSFPLPGGKSTGVCGGISLLVFGWYRNVVARLENQWDFGPLDWEAEVTRPFGDLRPTFAGRVTRQNLDAHRLRAYTTPMAQRRQAVCWAANLHAVWGNLDPPITWGERGANHAFLYEKIRENLDDPEQVLTPIYFGLRRVRSGRTSAHAVLAYRAFRATAVGSDGSQRDAVYLPIADPNVVARPGNYGRILRTRYLIYFPDEERFSWGREYRDMWAGYGRRIQTGTYLDDRELGFMNYANADNGRARLQLSVSDRCRDLDEAQLAWNDRETGN